MGGGRCHKVGGMWRGKVFGLERVVLGLEF